MELAAFLVLGGVAGWIASLIMGTDASQGIFLNIVVGVVGAFIGGMLFSTFGSAGVTGFNVYSLVVSVVGAVVLLFVFRFFRSV